MTPMLQLVEGCHTNLLSQSVNRFLLEIDVSPGEELDIISQRRYRAVLRASYLAMAFWSRSVRGSWGKGELVPGKAPTARPARKAGA